VDLDQGEVPLVFEMPFSRLVLIFAIALRHIQEAQVT
jgi:hypothetical protein